MCTGLLYLFGRRWNRQGRVAASMSRHAYAAYLIHEPVISLLAFAASGIALYPLLKFGLASLIFIPLTFGLSILVLKIPGADRVL
jgi:surface polysaccharide O-acyltransferase-like enzyme